MTLNNVYFRDNLKDYEIAPPTDEGQLELDVGYIGNVIAQNITFSADDGADSTPYSPPDGTVHGPNGFREDEESRLYYYVAEPEASFEFSTIPIDVSLQSERE
jgi:hypothetical protein